MWPPESIFRRRSLIVSVAVLIFFLSALSLFPGRPHFITSEIYHHQKVTLLPRDAAANSTLGVNSLLFD